MAASSFHDNVLWFASVTVFKLPSSETVGALDGKLHQISCRTLEIKLIKKSKRKGCGGK